MSFIADLLARIGGSAASTGTKGCVLLIMDEPKMPKKLIEKQIKINKTLVLECFIFDDFLQ